MLTVSQVDFSVLYCWTTFTRTTSTYEGTNVSTIW